MFHFWNNFGIYQQFSRIFGMTEKQSNNCYNIFLLGSSFSALGTWNFT